MWGRSKDLTPGTRSTGTEVVRGTQRYPVVHDDPDVPDVPYVPIHGYQAPAYLAVRPHTTGWGQAKWAMIITPYRATLVFRLWLTLTWWRPVILAVIITGVIILVRVA